VQGGFGKFLTLMKVILVASKDLGWLHFLFSRNFNGVVVPRWGLLGIELESKHETFGPKGKHWYIKVVATDPDAQGKGYGSIMMSTLGPAADEHQLESYLETVGDENRSFYEKFGYKEVVGDIALEAEIPDGELVERLESGYIMNCGAGRNWWNSCPGVGPGKKGDIASLGLEKCVLVENRLEMIKSDYIKHSKAKDRPSRTTPFPPASINQRNSI
jgi:GNAT superfamily N-acetyltransferase